VELDLGKLMEQAQRLTRDLQGRQEELARREVEGQAGAGMVAAVMNGRGDLLRLRIDPKMFARLGNDQALVEDLIVAAVNAALGEVHKLQQGELASLAGPFAGASGLPGFPFGAPPAEKSDPEGKSR
jgi:DNA-binding YbaB/EbfC family protein